jgi:hypothetical protein
MKRIKFEKYLNMNHDDAVNQYIADRKIKENSYAGLGKISYFSVKLLKIKKQLTTNS